MAAERALETGLLKDHQPGSGPGPERLLVDNMLQKYCGEFGRWQLRHFVLTCLAWALEAFHTMVMIFADEEPDWRCVPGSSSGFDHGQRRSVCGLEPGSWEWVGGAGRSTVAQWGLVCEEKYKVGLVQALFFGGCMIGAGIFGHLSDSRLGRKGSLTVVCILNAVFGFLTALVPNYFLYCVLRLFTGFSTGGVGLCAFVLATEPIGPSKRGIAGMCTFYFFSTGIALLAGIAYIFPSWRALYVVSSIPSVAFLIFVIPFLSESPRWYIVRGKTNEAMKIMRTIAKTNGRHLPDGVTLTLDDEVNDNESCKPEITSSGVETKSVSTLDDVVNHVDEIAINNVSLTDITTGGNLIDVIHSPLTRVRLVLAVGINFACAVVYYGLSLNVINLETNLYLNVVLNAVAEMPAFAITAVLLNRFGRKPLAVGTQWFSAVFCFLGSLMGNDGVWKVLRMACGVVGIFGMAGTYNLLFIYTAELFPTVVRNAALGAATQASQMGAILAPFVVVLGGGFPFAVFGMCGLVGGILAYYLPETLNKPLYDTMIGMAEGEVVSSLLY